MDGILALEPEAAPGIPAEVEELAAERARARAAGEWGRSDELRDRIAALGWTVKDTKDGQRISKG